MPLAEYITEVMEMLSRSLPSHNEILVERVRALRWAERNGAYEQMYAALNRE
jgi:uncharacterized oxidoreductase